MLSHRHCPLRFRALGGLFVVSAMALRNALPGYLRSPVAPRRGGHRLPRTHPGRAGLSWRDWRHLCAGRAGTLLHGCAVGSAARRGLAGGAVLFPILSIGPADGGCGARSRRLLVRAPALYCMAVRLGARRGAALLAALCYSLFSPSALLMADVARDLGGYWYGRHIRH